MFHFLKSFIPAPLLDVYHRCLSWLAAAWYGHPSEEMVVIGVTGTNGKTTTSYLISKALEASEYPTGCTTTALFKIADREWLNDTKMTMLGRFQLQKYLRDMVNVGCRYAVVETSSQGIVQYRHRHINYDVAVFTNLTPEHIEAHGGFENYKQAKIELFRHTAGSSRKKIDGKDIPKIAILNAADIHAKDFAVPGLDGIWWYGKEEDAGSGQGEDRSIRAVDIQAGINGISFIVDGVNAHLNLLGLVNVENALAAFAVASALNIPLGGAVERLSRIPGIPGRFERVDEGQPWSVIVDYAPEPASLAKLYETVATLPRRRLIHVLGSCGGGRDRDRRPILGRMAGEKADIVIVTNEDPYDDDPNQIIQEVGVGARQAGKKEGESLFIIQDRREAIKKAIQEAQTGDLVLITGKGSEQAIMGAHGSRIPWDDREVVREEIRKIVGA